MTPSFVRAEGISLKTSHVLSAYNTGRGDKTGVDTLMNGPVYKMASFVSAFFLILPNGAHVDKVIQYIFATCYIE